MKPFHEANAKLTGFCTHPDSVVKLTVDPKDEDKLFRKQYPIATSLMVPVIDILKNWRDTGIIKRYPLSCKFNNPLLAVPKKDDQGKMTGVRLCLDIRTLNKFLIEDDKFQLPFIPDVLTALGGGALFGEYDLSSAYNQFKLAIESQKYTAFTWPGAGGKGEQWVFEGCPFGIKHIPSLFQRFIVHLFRDMPFVFAYIDNIAFASATWKEHLEHARMIVERLTSVNLRIKPSSYNIGNTQIKLLGHVISIKGVSIDPEKAKMIMDWPEPREGSNLASALGLGAFLRDHIRHYAEVTAPLEALKKQKVIEWDDTTRSHWKLFKRAFATAPILRFPDPRKRVVIAHDASQTGIGGVLYQPDDDELTITPDNIVAICSKQLNGSQRNYPVYKKELWGLIYCLRKFHSFIWGRRDVTVLTDHKPLVHILNQRNMTVALQQWVDVLMDYDLDIKYRPGVLHVAPDALSRMYTATYGDTSITWGVPANIKILENFEKVSSPSDYLCQQSLEEIKPLSAVRKRHQDLNDEGSRGGKKQGKKQVSDQPQPSLPARPYDNDDELDPAYIRSIFGSDDRSPFTLEELDELELAKTAGPIYAAHECFTARIATLAARDRGELAHEQLDYDELVAFTASGSTDAVPRARTLTDAEKLLVAQEKRGRKSPESEEQKQDLLHRAHEAGHFGEKAMLHHIDRQGYWWPKIRNDIQALIDECMDCRKHTVVKHGFRPSQSVTADGPGDHIQIDLAQFAKSEEGHEYCLVFVDVFTGFIVLRPMKNKKASTVARELWQIFCILGVPKVLQSDNGTEFCNQYMRALTTLIGVPHRFISEYNPRADGKVERVVRTVKQTVMKLLHGASSLWHLHLPYVQLSYNDKVQSLTGSTPFSLMFGRSPNNAKNYQADPVTGQPTLVSDWKKHQEQVLSLILPAVRKRMDDEQAKYRKRLDETRGLLTSYEIPAGSSVMIKDPKYLLNPGMRPTHAPMYIGPYIVARQNKYGTYILRDETGELLDRSVPLDQIKVRLNPHRPFKRGPAVFAPNVQIDEDSKQDVPVHVVDKILSHQLTDTDILYHVKWQGRPLSDSTWIKEGGVLDAATIDKYYREAAVKNDGKRFTRGRALCIRAVYPPELAALTRSD